MSLGFTGIGILCPNRNLGDKDVAASLKSVRFTPCCLGKVAGTSCASDMDGSDSQPFRIGVDVGDSLTCDKKLPEWKFILFFILR